MSTTSWASCSRQLHSYDLAGSDGGVFVFPLGSGFYGSLPGLGVKVSNIVGLVSTNDNGYDLVAPRRWRRWSSGRPKSSGFFGSLPGLGISVSNIVGMVGTPGEGGYFLVGSDGASSPSAC